MFILVSIYMCDFMGIHLCMFICLTVWECIRFDLYLCDYVVYSVNIYVCDYRGVISLYLYVSLYGVYSFIFISVTTFRSRHLCRVA